MDEIILKYLNGEASVIEREKLLCWLEENETNKKLFLKTRDAWLASGFLNISESDTKKAFIHFKERITLPKPMGVKKTIPNTIKVAASIAIITIVSVGSFLTGKKLATPQNLTSPLVVNQFFMGGESKGSVILPDGTIAWLNANSKLTYPESFSSDYRNVKLEGEGYFEVAPNTQSPFWVETNYMKIKVLGTHFDVKDYIEHDFSETTLLTGKVEVHIKENDQTFLLQPNQTITYNKKNNTYALEQVDAKDYIVWKEDRLSFTNETLANVFYKMEKWYNIKISCDPRISLEQRLSLTIRKESKEEIFKLLALIAPIKYEIKEHTVYVK